MPRKNNMTDSEMKEWLETQYELVDDCWVWKGFKNQYGYGLIKRKEITYRVHRLFWLLSGRTIPEGLEMCHGPCHNRACFNPDHLTPGSAENCADKVRDGTWQGGEKCYLAKLTEEKVKAIRNSTKTQKALAKEYGVAESTISHIITRRTWTHI